MTGAEALIRVKGGGGHANAEDIMSVSATAGLSDQLTQALFDALETQGKALFAALPDLEKISINFSPLELRSAKPVICLENIIRNGAFKPHQLQVEITEQSVLERGSDQALRAIDRIAELNVPIVMDDFGTGYSSLTHLKMLPISGIKIDKSFVRELNNDPKDAAIVRSLLGLCKGMGLKVTAEGIETFAQYETLRHLGCDLAQGHLFFAAGSVEDLDERINRGANPALDWIARPQAQKNAGTNR